MTSVPINIHIPTTPILCVAIGAGLMGVGVMAALSGVGVRFEIAPEFLEASRKALVASAN